MDTKAAFEKWRDENQELLSGKLKVTPATAFIIWTASRAAIEIELPTEKTYRRDSGPILRAQNCGYNDAVADCESIIASHGIRIKGKTE